MKKFPEKKIWISGINPIKEALRADTISAGELLVARKDLRGQEIEELAKERGLPVSQSTREHLTEIVGHVHHQGIVLSQPEFPYTSIERILERPCEERDPILVLDSIQDPHNLGAILRSACFLGARAVFIPKDRAAQVTSAVIRTAAGATSYVSVARITNISRVLKQLKQAGYWVAGLDVGGKLSLYDADLRVPLCLVIGNEQKGIRPLVRSECDLLLRIPACGPLDSLNAASAATIALAEVQRQRLSSKK